METCGVFIKLFNLYKVLTSKRCLENRRTGELENLLLKKKQYFRIRNVLFKTGVKLSEMNVSFRFGGF